MVLKPPPHMFIKYLFGTSVNPVHNALVELPPARTGPPPALCFTGLPFPHPPKHSTENGQ